MARKLISFSVFSFKSDIKTIPHLGYQQVLEENLAHDVSCGLGKAYR